MIPLSQSICSRAILYEITLDQCLVIHLNISLCATWRQMFIILSSTLFLIAWLTGFAHILLAILSIARPVKYVIFKICAFIYVFFRFIQKTKKRERLKNSRWVNGLLYNTYWIYEKASIKSENRIADYVWIRVEIMKESWAFFRLIGNWPSHSECPRIFKQYMVLTLIALLVCFPHHGHTPPLLAHVYPGRVVYYCTNTAIHYVSKKMPHIILLKANNIDDLPVKLG